MGSFSWLKADALGDICNIASDMPFKFLIPEKFGGGFIFDESYQDYGYLGRKEDGRPMYDMYELLAFWNCDPETLKWDGDFTYMKQIDKYTDENRSRGINIGCYDWEIAKLKYPLKLVSPEYNRTYEQCLARSFSDPDQGFSPVYRMSKDKYMDCDGELIQSGHILLCPDDIHRKVYKCTDQNWHEDLGILATNPAFLQHHPDWPLEFYSLNYCEPRKCAIIDYDVT